MSSAAPSSQHHDDTSRLSRAYATLPHVHDWLVRARAWIGILILVPFGVVAFMTPPYAAEGSTVDFLIDAMAWLLFIAGGTFRWWATLYIGSRKQCELVTEGPYSLCRNPLYVGTFLIVLSIAVFLQSAIFAAGLGLASLVYLTTTLSIEENHLRLRFGTSSSPTVTKSLASCPVLLDSIRQPTPKSV